MLAVDVVKRGGMRPSEQFERAKLEKSIRATLSSLKTPDGQAADTARAVCDLVEQWLDGRPEVTSHDLRRQAARALAPLHPEAAIFYEQHKMIL